MLFSLTMKEAVESKFHAAVRGEDLTRERKSQIAESAILFRLALHGFSVSGPVFDCARSDWFVHAHSSPRVLRIQVKSVVLKGRIKRIPLTCRDYTTTNRSKVRRYSHNEFDFVVGYDLYTDIAYVVSSSEIPSDVWSYPTKESAAERWDKLKKRS